MSSYGQAQDNYSLKLVFLNLGKLMHPYGPRVYEGCDYSGADRIGDVGFNFGAHGQTSQPQKYKIVRLTCVRSEIWYPSW